MFKTKKQEERKAEEEPLKQKEKVAEEEHPHQQQPQQSPPQQPPPQQQQQEFQEAHPQRSTKVDNQKQTSSHQQQLQDKDEVPRRHSQPHHTHQHSPNQFNLEKFPYQDDNTVQILSLTETDPKRHEEVRRTMKFTPTTLQQVGRDLRFGDLPEGKISHTTRLATINDHERVIITKTVTKVSGEEVAVHTRQISHDLDHRPINLGIAPNLPIFEGNLRDRLRIKTSQLQPLDMLLRNVPNVHLANPELRQPDLNLILNHIDPNLGIELKPIDTKMKINYEMEEEAMVKAVKIVKPVDIEQRILKKTTKEVRSIPTIVELGEVCSGDSIHSHGGHNHLEGGATFRMTSSTSKTATTATTATTSSQNRDEYGNIVEEDRENGSKNLQDMSESESNEFITSAIQATTFSEQATQEAKDIKTKGLSIVETLKRQADELRQAAIMTNKGIEELDAARQAEVHARLNSHRLVIEHELEAKISEEQELILRVRSNADKVKAQVTDQLQSEFARIQALIKAEMDSERGELDTLRDRFFSLEKENLAKIEPWVKTRMDELTSSLEDCQKQLEKSRIECTETLQKRLRECDIETKDRIEKITEKLRDEITQLQQCLEMIEREENDMFLKRRKVDEERMKKELQDQIIIEHRFIEDCRSQVEVEVTSKIQELIEIAKLRKSELDKQVEREKLMIDHYCTENIRSLNTDKQLALEASKRREGNIIERQNMAERDINVSWDLSLHELNLRLDSLRGETARREEELTETLDQEIAHIKALYEQRSEEITNYQSKLADDVNLRKKALEDDEKEIRESIESISRTASEDCQQRIKQVETMYANSEKSFISRQQKFLDALNLEKTAHEEELERLIIEAEERAKSLSLDITVSKERLLDNSMDYEEELRRCQALVAEKEKILLKLRAIEEERKRAVFSTESAFSNMRMELELTRQALGSLRLSSEDIEAKTHQYAIESKGSRVEQVSENSASATASKSFAIETSVDAGGQVHKNISNETSTRITRNKSNLIDNNLWKDGEMKEMGGRWGMKEMNGMNEMKAMGGWRDGEIERHNIKMEGWRDGEMKRQNVEMDMDMEKEKEKHREVENK